MEKRGIGKTIWISAGEASGDMHGALLLAALRERGVASGLGGMRFTGMGGPAMEAAGFDKAFDIGELSLMGLTEVLAHLPRILGLMRRMYRRMRVERPAAVVCIDSPDFNFFVVRMARRLGIPVFYYICPQVWAWRTGRVNFLREKVERVLCILPFEKPFLARHGLEADYVGHPLTDQIPLAELDAMSPEPGRVLILPGSRRKEIGSLYDEFIAAARLMREARPELTFAVVRAPGVARETLAAHLPDDFPVELLEPEARYREMRRAEAIIAASGTVTLETALVGTPTVVAYRLSPMTFAVGRMIVDVPFISLPNLILGEEVFPELLQEDACARVVAERTLAMLEPERGRAVRGSLARLRELVGEPGAPERAASIILERLRGAASGA
ncbi:lipid-A-disaccharide synthase [Desulfobaculum xiamenense]|uniref:Lipid-A-disaccharide synthase n=1 Tax=Desulfobaculum xiamenense TaxID=995050 RepID=A0A846QNA0_9BACT|nr:lipid-A-disaccharide synthase [Desulfobaculum xiamenense]